MYDKREVVSSTLKALGLDLPGFPSGVTQTAGALLHPMTKASAIEHAACMRAIMSGEAPPQLRSGQPQHMPAQPTPKTSGAPLPTTMLSPAEGIPDGNASAIAVVNYVLRTLQIMIWESSMFKSNLMWGQKFQSWRLVFAMIPAAKDTPPTFCNVTWKKDQYGKWKTMNTPLYSALFKDLRNRNTTTESMHIQLHSSDFAHLPLGGNMKWLIEFPPAWSWS